MSESTAEPGKINLEGALNLRAVEALRPLLLEGLSPDARIEIDCSAVTQVDLSGVQLLLAALKSARLCGKPVSVVQPRTGELARILSRAGLTEAFDGLTEGGEAIAGPGSRAS
jgi:anti-anti-sigma regulatory factor